MRETAGTRRIEKQEEPAYAGGRKRRRIRNDFEETMILGITGGVGTGKSTVLQYLQDQYGAFLIRLDDVARELQQPGEACYAPMLELFRSRLAGEQEPLLHSDGTFNRSAIAGMVYSDEDLLHALNRIVHPAVKKRCLELIDSHTDEPLIVLEAALLLEDHYDEICDEIWFIYAEESVRRERLKNSRGYSDEKIAGMLASQRPDESYRACCALTIDNSSENIENTFRQLDEALIERGFHRG